MSVDIWEKKAPKLLMMFSGMVFYSIIIVYYYASNQDNLHALSMLRQVNVYVGPYALILGYLISQLLTWLVKGMGPSMEGHGLKRSLYSIADGLTIFCLSLGMGALFWGILLMGFGV